MKRNRVSKENEVKELSQEGEGEEREVKVKRERERRETIITETVVTKHH